MSLIEQNKIIQISEDIWGYKIDCYSGILYINQKENTISYDVEIMAGDYLVESSSFYDFDDAKKVLEEAVKTWYQYSINFS